MGFIDIHQHINFGLDDGAVDLPAAARMAERAYAGGVTAIIATTHALPGRARFDLDKYKENLEALAAYCRAHRLPVALYAGSEVLYADSAVDDLLSGRFPTLAGSRYVLVEFDPDIPYDALARAVRVLGNAGFAPVIAHIERYACLMRSAERVREVRLLYGARTQINAATVVRSRGVFASRTLDRLLNEGSVDYIASDAHNLTARGIHMKEAYDLLKKRYGHERAFEWFGGAQRDILEDQYGR